MITKTVIVDLDGTVADTSHRSHMVNKEGATDWVAYSMECAEDKPIVGVIELLNLLPIGDRIVLLTGRAEQARKLTERWLRMNRVRYDDLIMRGAGNLTPNVQYKLDKAAKLRKEGSRLALVIDDYPAAIAAFQSIGVPGLLVAHNGKGFARVGS